MRKPDANWGPICPVCQCPYGEHRPGCEVPDNYHDSGEGPWDTLGEAQLFAQAEVGAPCKVVMGADGKAYIVVKSED